jgi:DNA primase
VDLALPKLAPGKSLKFATLPEGQDPDDLLRSGGREAVADVIAQARPLADMLWLRETEQGTFDTPERRAALEARINDVMRQIADENVRKYYKQDFDARIAGFFQLTPRQSGGAPSFGGGGGGYARRPAMESWRRDALPARVGRGGFREGRNSATSSASYSVVSQQLAGSSVMRGPRTSIPRREALILLTVLNHPWLLHDHLEELSSIDFRHPDAEKLKGAVIDGFAHDGTGDAEPLRADLIRRGFAELLDRLARAITTPSVWGAEPNAAPNDVLITWQQLVALHRQAQSLVKELKDAEYALAQEPSEANFTWLRDVKARLAVLDGTEALIEGFGAASGRSAKTM